MASYGWCSTQAREDEQRCEERDSGLDAGRTAGSVAGTGSGSSSSSPGAWPWWSVHHGEERADVWWASMLRTRYEDSAIEVTCAEFTRLFRAKFIPEHIQDKMEQKFLSLTQGSITVFEYEARFAEHSKYAPHIVADERRKAKKFVMGLKPSLRSRLVAFDHRTLDEALSATCRKEREMDQYIKEKRAAQERSVPPF
ncbi:hypothetical protein Taro_001536 [Colocasia esculenta]|uniref:Retrotransposon gag domain-containing protein n=1 Tax=Colocasia esculenta TaxID=4460 RepID=A0A843TEW4_COLES|nr:hypothetical protein [Colocasia esculenta]